MDFQETPLYRTRYVKAPLPDDSDRAVFTSASAVRGFAACTQEDWQGFAAVKAVCIGELTAPTAREAGFTQIFTASPATLPALVDAAAAARGVY